MAHTVTPRDELARLTSGETIDGYLPGNDNVAKSLAAHADATDCIYFEGALTDRPGGVVRVEAFDIASVILDLHHVLPGYIVTAIDPLLFSTEAALESAVEEGRVNDAELRATSAEEVEPIVDELREEFRLTHDIQQPVDEAMRIELVAPRA